MAARFVYHGQSKAFQEEYLIRIQNEKITGYLLAPDLELRGFAPIGILAQTHCQ